MFTIPLPPYLCEYIYYHYGKPAAFPRLSTLNAVMFEHLKAYKTAAARDAAAARTGRFPLCLFAVPSKVKLPSPFAYITTRGARLLREELISIFLYHLRTDVKTATGGTEASRLYAWMRRNGVSAAHFETLRKRLYREKKKNIFAPSS